MHRCMPPHPTACTPAALGSVHTGLQLVKFTTQCTLLPLQDPADIVEEYGADALRLYLINSPVVRAESLRFRREGVQGVVRDVFIPWYNAFRFLVQNVLRLEASGRLPAGLLPFNPAQVGTRNVWDAVFVCLAVGARRDLCVHGSVLPSVCSMICLRRSEWGHGIRHAVYGFCRP